MGKKSNGSAAGPSTTHSRGSKHRNAALGHASREGLTRAAESSAPGAKSSHEGAPHRTHGKKPSEVKLSSFIPVTQLTRLFRGAALRTMVLAHPDNDQVQCTIETDARGFVRSAKWSELPSGSGAGQATASCENDTNFENQQAAEPDKALNHEISRNEIKRAMPFSCHRSHFVHGNLRVLKRLVLIHRKPSFEKKQFSEAWLWHQHLSLGKLSNLERL